MEERFKLDSIQFGLARFNSIRFRLDSIWFDIQVAEFAAVVVGVREGDQNAPMPSNSSDHIVMLAEAIHCQMYQGARRSLANSSGGFPEGVLYMA